MANGLYLRLSIADGDLGKENKDESNSIDNQRSLLVSFITDREDMSDEYIEYVVRIPKEEAVPARGRTAKSGGKRQTA